MAKQKSGSYGIPADNWKRAAADASRQAKKRDCIHYGLCLDGVRPDEPCGESCPHAVAERQALFAPGGPYEDHVHVCPYCDFRTAIPEILAQHFSGSGECARKRIVEAAQPVAQWLRATLEMREAAFNGPLADDCPLYVTNDVVLTAGQARVLVSTVE